MMKNTQAKFAPFDPGNDAAYMAWREQKLHAYPGSIEELIVEVNDPGRLSKAEHAAIHARCSKTNMAIYAGPGGSDPDKAIPKSLGEQFGLTQLDCNMGADDDGVTALKVVGGASGATAISSIPTGPFTGTPMVITTRRQSRSGD